MDTVIGIVATVVFILGRKWRDEDQLCANCRRYYDKCRCSAGWWEL